MMLKALPLVHFWSVLLLKEQMMTSVRKTLKRLVWSAQNRLISSEICLESNHKIGRFLPNSFQRSLPWKLPRNSRIGRFFREFVPKNPVKFGFFFRDLSEALLRRQTRLHQQKGVQISVPLKIKMSHKILDLSPSDQIPAQTLLSIFHFEANMAWILVLWLQNEDGFLGLSCHNEVINMHMYAQFSKLMPVFYCLSSYWW